MVRLYIDKKPSSYIHIYIHGSIYTHIRRGVEGFFKYNRTSIRKMNLYTNKRTNIKNI